MAFKIITDTSSNLPGNILRAKDIDVLPFCLYLNGTEQEYVELEKFDGHTFYEAIKKGAKATTSQINPQKYEDLFEKYLAQGMDILYVSMAGGISSSFMSSQIAANLLLKRYPERKILCADTMTASLGEGIPAIRAAEYRDQGMSLEDTFEALTALIKRTHSIFTVDDLMCLKRGGRLSNLAAAAGIVLQIKPILKGNEVGKIVSVAKIRGRRKSIEALYERYVKLVVNPQEQTIGIAQADCPEDAEYLIHLIQSSDKAPRDILNVMYEPVTGAHVGPGALALFFESFEGVRLEN